MAKLYNQLWTTSRWSMGPSGGLTDLMRLWRSCRIFIPISTYKTKIKPRSQLARPWLHYLGFRQVVQYSRSFGPRQWKYSCFGAHRYMTRYTARFIREVHRRRTLPSILRPLRHIYYDTYLTCAYLLVKVFYAGNVVGQLFLLDRFLGTDFRLYGVSVLQRMLAGQDWTTSSKFPRVTLCDFQIRYGRVW